ncbi:MAG: ABC transporter ATP-binding protein [Alphaproteobacteria bacterium]|nr:ABC transporter ATP-binding protein [Alphaproteobacteria bacterium]
MTSSPASETVLDVKNLNVYIKTAVGPLQATKDVSFQVRRGETLAIVGESGCGKTITSLALMGLLPKAAFVQAESCNFAGTELQGLTRSQLSRIRGKSMSMIFQDPMTSLNPVYTIGDQLAEVYVKHGMGNKRAARERAIMLLERVGIKNAAERLSYYPHQLSGGLRQRVVIAMALMCGPQLIIADEPTTALDVTVQARTLALLGELQREFGLALILITHDLGIVASMADRVAVMYAGCVVEAATTEELFRSPLHPYTQGLMRCIPGRHKAGDSHLHTIPGMVPSLVEIRPGCVFQNRCAMAIERCGGSDIELRDVEEAHSFRCIMPQAELASSWLHS